MFVQSRGILKILCRTFDWVKVDFLKYKGCYFVAILGVTYNT